jgi:hypothetical protein
MESCCSSKAGTLKRAFSSPYDAAPALGWIEGNDGHCSQTYAFDECATTSLNLGAKPQQLIIYRVRLLKLD